MRDLADLQNLLKAAFGVPQKADGAMRAPERGLQTGGGEVVTLPLPAVDFAVRAGLDPAETPGASTLGEAGIPAHANGGLQALLDAQDLFGVPALVRTLDGLLLVANRSFQTLTGYPDDRPVELEELGISLRAAPSFDPYDVEVSTRSGFRILAWQDARLISPSGGESLFFSIARDVTDERDMAHLREEARLRAEKAAANKSRQVATVVHELRTPLNGILGMSHLLWQTSLTPEQKNYIGGIRQAGSALSQLVDDLLDYATMEAGRFRLNSRAENLRQLLESVVEMLAPRAHEKGIEIGATVSWEVPSLMDFDPARLRQVLFNVIGNAVKFTARGGVMIRACVESNDLVISVTDTGPGMSDAAQKKIFEDFEQAGNAEERSGGTGLGLAISARILEEFNGSLTVISEIGKGSTFTIRFPAVRAEGGKESSNRMVFLRSSRVLFVAPAGPAATATIATIETLGGRCRHVQTVEEAERALAKVGRQGGGFTDMIVDHRIAGQMESQPAADLRRILLVSPEERGSQPWDSYDAWLIRPLREQSLVDVLRGRLGGLANRPMEQAPDAAAPPPTDPATEGFSVLLAEDDPVSAMMVAAVLRRAGYDVRHVSDMDALQQARRDQRPDLIISDIHMPGGNLTDVLPTLEVDQDTLQASAPPLLVLSGETDGRIQAQILAHGAKQVLQKPVDPQVLLQEVRSALLASQGFRRTS